MFQMQLTGRTRIAAIAAALFLAALLPAEAAVTTIHSCPSSGHNGNHDSVLNGFYIADLNASNLHSVQLYYTTSQNGAYNLTLTARRGSFAGPLVGSVTKTVNLSTSSDTAVTWDFADAPINSGDDLYFSHTESSPGTIQFNMQANQCAGNEVTAGLSNVLNGFSIATTLTTNTVTTPPACNPNATTVCIDDQVGDKRFQVRATYSTTQGGGLSGSAKAIQLSSLGVNQGGLFWFFSAGNPEILVKVLNGCSSNNRFWVFFSAGTNVGFQLNVTDTKNGHTANYTSADLVASKPVQDTNALSCN